MRIGIFTDTFTPTRDGVVTSILNYKAELEKHGHEIIVFCPEVKDFKDRDKNEIRFFNVRFPNYKEYSIVFPFAKKFKLAQIKDLKLDIIHIQSFFGMGILGAYLSKKYNIPAIYTYHTFYDLYLHYLPGKPILYRKLIKLYTKRYCNKFSLIIAPSKIIKNYLLEYGVKTKIEVLPSGLKINELKVTDKSIREKWGIPSNNLLFCSAGRLGKEKSFDLLIKSLAIFKKKEPNFRLLLMGDGPEKKALLKLSKKLDLEKNIIFAGYVSHQSVLNVMAASDLFLFTSHSETQGLVVIEAFAMGTPVVAVNALGVGEILEETKAGVLTKVCPEDFAAKTWQIISNQKLLKEKSVLAKQKAQSYTIEYLTQKLISHYQYSISTFLSSDKPKTNKLQ
ncbi:glycosyltransferase [Candidatus Margulisiibacteriota bacterium]